MARFTATWTDTEEGDWDAGDGIYADKFEEQVGQNIEYLAQTHDHSGDPGDGGTLALANPLAIAFYGPASGS